MLWWIQFSRKINSSEKRYNNHLSLSDLVIVQCMYLANSSCNTLGISIYPISTMGMNVFYVQPRWITWKNAFFVLLEFNFPTCRSKVHWNKFSWKRRNFWGKKVAVGKTFFRVIRVFERNVETPNPRSQGLFHVGPKAESHTGWKWSHRSCQPARHNSQAQCWMLSPPPWSLIYGGGGP